MKSTIALAVVSLLSQTIVAFAGPEVSSKEVVAPPPPPLPEYFRPNEFDIGAFGNYDTGVGSGGGKLHAWGGGMDFTYWFPWKYAGVRFQGTGASIRGGGGSREVTFVDGFTLRTPRTVGGGSVAAGVITSDGLLRLPLDEFWPGIHLAPYAFIGFGGIILGSPDQVTFSQQFTITNDTTGQTKKVNVTARRLNTLGQHFGTDRVLGHVGGGLEYRFTPHIGLFGEIGYDFPNGSDNNFVAVNFGLRWAF